MSGTYEIYQAQQAFDEIDLIEQAVHRIRSGVQGSDGVRSDG